MKKIISRANTKETAEACIGVVELSKKHPITDDPYYSLTFEKLATQTEDLIEKMNAGWLTSELRESDELRDTDVKALFYEVEAKCMRRPDASQEKAMRVQAILDRYGMKIVGSSYTNESSQVRAMLSDLKAPNLAKDIRSLSDLKQLMMNLEESQAGFDMASAKFIERKLERENTKPASVVAKELKDTFNDEMCTYLGAMAQANPDKYKTLADLLHVLIEESNKKVRDRLTALKKKKEEAEVN